MFINIVCSCNNRSSGRAGLKDLPALKEKIFKYGDKEAYTDLKVYLLDSPAEDILFWALIMANKHNDPQANLDVFHAIVVGYAGEVERFFEMDKRTQDLAMEYLIAAKSQGVLGAKEIYDDLKTKGKVSP